MLESQATPEVCPAGMGLMLATPGRPVQCVGDAVRRRGHQCDESAYFGEGEFNEFSVDPLWLSGSGRLIG